jgi:hypothetical protein
MLDSAADDQAQPRPVTAAVPPPARHPPASDSHPPAHGGAAAGQLETAEIVAEDIIEERPAAAAGGSNGTPRGRTKAPRQASGLLAAKARRRYRRQDAPHRGRRALLFGACSRCGRVVVLRVVPCRSTSGRGVTPRLCVGSYQPAQSFLICRRRATEPDQAASPLRPPPSVRAPKFSGRTLRPASTLDAVQSSTCRRAPVIAQSVSCARRPAQARHDTLFQGQLSHRRSQAWSAGVGPESVRRYRVHSPSTGHSRGQMS